MLKSLESALSAVDRRVIRIAEVEYDHPLVRSYYDIDEYTFREITKLTGPVLGLEIDGRLTAVAGVQYRYEKSSGYTGSKFTGFFVKPHLSNLLYINVFAYGLIQPSQMGGRYLAHDSGNP